MDVTSALTVAAVSLVIAAVYYHIKAFSFWSSRGIKGPTPWPLFGTGIYYMIWNKLDVDVEWHRRYGKTFGLYDGYWPVLRTSDNELIKHVMIKDFQSFTDRNNRFIHGDVVKKWIFWSEGNHWSNQRALLSPVFTTAKLKTMYNVMLNSKTRFIDEMTGRLTSPNSNDIDNKLAHSQASLSKDDLMALGLDFISQGFFSLKLDTYKRKATEFYKRAYAFANFSIPYFLVWVMTPNFLASWLKFDLVSYSQYEYFDKLTMSILSERRRTGQKKNDFIQNLIEAQIPDDYRKVYSKEDDNDAHYNDRISHDELESINKNQTMKADMRNFSDLEIRGQTTFFFLAGFETTSSSLSFCLLELAHEQAAQEEVYQELLAKIGDRDQFNYEDFMELKKFEAFISETLRLHSPVIENNRKVTNKDGYLLPTGPDLKLPYGCAISVNAFIVQRNEEYWQDPLKFDMTRFYPENRDKIKSCTYLPFGLGPRNCLGMRSALLLMRTVLAHLLLKYKVLPGAGTNYPPEYNRHAFFLQLAKSDIRLDQR